MATRPLTISHVIDSSGSVVPGVYQVKWTGLQNGDDGQPLVNAYGDKNVQFYGTFGAGGSVTLQGTNDQVYSSTPSGGSSIPVANWQPLTDVHGGTVTKTNPAIVEVVENPLAVRPAVLSGDATTNITAVLIIKTVKLKV